MINEQKLNTSWKQGAFGVGGIYVYFQRMIQGASNKEWIGLLGNKIRSKTDHGEPRFNGRELFDSRLWRCYNLDWKKICVGSVGQLSKNIYRIEKGEKWEKGARKVEYSGREESADSTVASRLICSVRLVECSGAECASGMLIADRPSQTEPFAHASASYNSLISPQAYLFRTWDSPRNHVLRSQLLRLKSVGLSTPLRVIHKRFDIRFSIIYLERK